MGGTLLLGAECATNWFFLAFLLGLRRWEVQVTIETRLYDQRGPAYPTCPVS